MKIFAALLCGLLFVGFASNASAAGRLMHVVAFKFKPSATPQDIKKVEVAFEQLKHKIPQVVTLEWGTNVSPEQRNKGFTHCFVLSFKTDKDRDAYLEHPEHKAFGKLVGPVLDDVFVVDFWSKP
ncbi:MAG TPA: Dabb family protein [Verrucomicrobiae bacterium]|nr:Dabb family protein [Verrucomicrobiae bacterium]